MFILHTLVTLARTLRFMGAYVVANVQAAMEYRISFWVQIFTMVANDSLWLFFWVSYFRLYPLVHGWQNTDIVVIFCSLAFFLGNTEGLTQQLLGILVTFSTYPMNIFNGVVRLLLFTVIPAGLISFVPLQLLHQFSWPLLGAMVGFTVLIISVAAGIFQLGL